MLTYIHLFIQTYIVYMHTYINTYMHTHTYIHTYTYTYIHTHTYMHTYTHSCMHAHTHTHTYVWPLLHQLWSTGWNDRLQKRYRYTNGEFSRQAALSAVFIPRIPITGRRAILRSNTNYFAIDPQTKYISKKG